MRCSPLLDRNKLTRNVTAACHTIGLEDSDCYSDRADTIEAMKIIADVRTLAREIAPEALETLKSVMLDTKAPPAARIGAATAILDRAYGKPGQAVNVSSAVETYDLEKLSDEDLETLGQILTPVDC